MDSMPNIRSAAENPPARWRKAAPWLALAALALAGCASPDLAAYQKAESIGSPQAYQSFLTLYPKSQYAIFATIKLGERDLTEKYDRSEAREVAWDKLVVKTRRLSLGLPQDQVESFLGVPSRKSSGALRLTDRTSHAVTPASTGKPATWTSFTLAAGDNTITYQFANRRLTGISSNSSEVKALPASE